jgi:hypothetical protein
MKQILVFLEDLEEELEDPLVVIVGEMQLNQLNPNLLLRQVLLVSPSMVVVDRQLEVVVVLVVLDQVLLVEMEYLLVFQGHL